jgi:23S rRNA pseudouridine2457 synthase
MKYIKFYKPFEVLCQFSDAHGRPTLKNFINVSGIYSAGRLDYRSEGLLILTNDGRMIQRLTDPRFDHPKTYLVEVEGHISDGDLTPLFQKSIISGVLYQPAFAQVIPQPELPARSKPVRPYHPTSWVKIVLTEGKKHQIRRLTAAIGYPTLRLVRIAIGQVTINELQPGKWCDLTHQELIGLKDDLGI